MFQAEKFWQEKFEEKIMVFKNVRNLSSSAECLDGVRYHIRVFIRNHSSVMIVSPRKKVRKGDGSSRSKDLIHICSRL